MKQRKNIKQWRRKSKKILHDFKYSTICFRKKNICLMFMIFQSFFFELKQTYLYPAREEKIVLQKKSLPGCTRFHLVFHQERFTKSNFNRSGFRRIYCTLVAPVSLHWLRDRSTYRLCGRQNRQEANMKSTRKNLCFHYFQ